MSLADLKKKREELKSGLDIRVKAMNPEDVVQVKVAMATCGIASGAKTIMEFFLEQLDRRNIAGIVTQTGCMGYCYAEPTIEVKLPGQDPVVFGFDKYGLDCLPVSGPAQTIFVSINKKSL